MLPQRTPLAPVQLIPQETSAIYREKGYWQDQTIPDFLWAKYTEFAQAPALIAQTTGSVGTLQEEKQLTYQQLKELSIAATQRLQKAGLQPGDRVLVQIGNYAEYLIYLTAVFWAGALPVFCMPAHRAELLHFARKTDAAVHLYASGAPEADYTKVHQELVAGCEAEGLVPPLGIDVSEPLESQPEEGFAPLNAHNTDRELASEQVAFLQLSGGTTGVSKLIPRTHAAYLYSVRESARICRLTQETKMLVVLPACHNFTMSSPGILGVIDVGATLVFAADPSPQTAFSLISKEKVTFTSLVPPLAQAWVSSAQRRNPDLGSLEVLQVGGSKLLSSVAEKIEPVLGARLQQVFGMAEGLVNYTDLDDSAELIFETQGLPISPDDEILIVDDDGVEVADGESGHLLTRGPYTIRSYYLEDGANRTSFTEDGYYRTGDIVRRRPEGHLEVTGRSKDQINRNGEKIAVDEVEDLVLTYPGVHDAVVLGIPDETVGERVCLVVVPEPGADMGKNPRMTFHEFLTQKGLAQFKIPERVEVMENLPITNVGKISRKAVRSQLLDILN